MKKLILGLTLAASMLATSSVKADIVLSGEFNQFTGPGTVSIDIFATSDAGDGIYNIAAVNLAPNLSEVGGANVSYVNNPVFNLPAPTVNLGNLVPGAWGVGGTVTVPVGGSLVVNEQVPELLGTLTFDATSVGEINFESLATFLFQPDTQAIDVNLSASGLRVTAIPEPGSFALTGLALVSMVGWRSRRCRRSFSTKRAAA